MAITDWPADERPREKLMQKGVEVLSDAELLAIFLRVGVVGKSAVLNVHIGVHERPDTSDVHVVCAPVVGHGAVEQPHSRK